MAHVVVAVVNSDDNIQQAFTARLAAMQELVAGSVKRA